MDYKYMMIQMFTPSGQILYVYRVGPLAKSHYEIWRGGVLFHTCDKLEEAIDISRKLYHGEPVSGNAVC